MGMGIVSDKDFREELTKLNPSVPSPTNPPKTNPTSPEATIVDVNKGRGNGNKEVPNALRNIIGETAIEAGREEALELSRSFGISPSSVSAYTQGSTSTSSYHTRPNLDSIRGVKDKIASKARVKLIKAINHITDEKLEAAKLTEVSMVAKDMATVMKHMEDKDETVSKQSNQPTFVFYSPQVRKEEVFDTIQAKE